jgi:SecD/SecF fusion protein
MQRNYLRGLLICLIPILVAAVFAVRLDKYKLGIDLAGGTILVYEINLERKKNREDVARAAGQTVEPIDMNALAAQIKRRIDPTDIKNVTVRPIGDTRFEIILPFPSPFANPSSGQKENLTAEEIQEVKRLISQMGVLEFRILANGVDDADGVVAARDAMAALTVAQLNDLANEGKPPPGPSGRFNVTINDTSAKVEYQWVELGPEFRRDIGLSNANEGQSILWKTMEEARKNVADPRRRIVAVSNTTPVADDKTATAFLFSRDVPANSPDGDRVVKAALRAVREGKLPDLTIREDMTNAQIYDAVLANPKAVELLNPKRFEYFILTRVTPRDTRPDDPRDSLKVEGDITLTANAGQDDKFNPAIDFSFNAAGAQLFGKLTRRNRPTGSMERQLAVLLDDRLVSAASIRSEITSRGQITGRFDRDKVNEQVKILRSGSLSAELREEPVSENTIGPTLGADTIRKGTTAIGLAFLAVLVFMLVYYRFAGMVACIALFANLLLTVGFMVAVNAAFTLPGLAGLVLTLGMAVDANVLIYERLREERNKGANLITAIRNGYDRAFPTIIDTHLTSIFTAIVLYTFGNDQLKGFAITLTLGLIISLFTALYMTRLIFDYGLHRKWITELRMLRLFEKPNFQPMKYRFVFFSITAGLTLAGLGLFLYRGEAGLNVDFRGGTVFAGQLREGEERGLIKTSDGKLGFRELLSEENQKKRLNPVAVEWENKPIGTANETPAEREAKIAALNRYIYTIEYADGQKATVTLNQKPGPAGNYDEAAMAQDVLTRASRLPDVSVEQTFRSGESYPEGKSRHFTIRTTEKQQDLVRANLDRLLRDESGKPLVDGATMSYRLEKTADGSKEFLVKSGQGPEVAVPVAVGGVVELEFDRPTSLNFVRSLLERELAISRIEPRLTLTGDEATKIGDRFTRMRLSLADNPAFSELKAIPPLPEQAEQRQTRLQQLATNPAVAEQLVELARVLERTRIAFNASPEPERLEVFDSQLASEIRTKAFYAILASWIAVLLYLWFRFGNWTFGLAAVICLIHDLCFTLGAIAGSHYVFDLPGMNLLLIEDFKIDLAAVAALLTLVGFSVNDTIVVFDRIREVRGKNPKLTPAMIDESVNQTLSRTILTSAIVFMVSLVLYVFGGEGVHLFSFVMVVGVLVGTYSSIFVAAPLLLMFGEGQKEEAGPAATDEPQAPEGAEEEVVEG